MTLPSVGTAPSPPAPARSRGASRGTVLGAGLLVGAACALALWSRWTRRSPAPGQPPPETWTARTEEGPASRPGREPRPRIRGAYAAMADGHPAVREERAARRLSWGASALSFSILADSAAEHCRGGFHNPVMYVAPAVSALTLLGSTAQALGATVGRGRDLLFGAAVLTGLVGIGFHARNTSRRIGGWSWENLFYGPPVAAPLGLTSAGLMGLAAIRPGSVRGARPSWRGSPLPARVLGAAAATGLLGTAAEAGVLHFRGAFHRPAMYIPVTLPPAAALALASAALRPSAARRRRARALLRATAAAGFAGMGFHAQGVQRSMGGWRNWSQNLLAGPPLPAPPSFTGMALAGLAALLLLEEEAG